MLKASETSHRDVFDVLPITFVIDYSDKTLFDMAMDKFTIFFNTIEKNKLNGTLAVN
jgi:hypothetical protein